MRTRLFLFLLSLAPLFLAAQPAPKKPDVGKQMALLIERLKPDAVQTEKIERILTEHRARIEALMENNDLDKRQRFRALQKIRREKEEQIRAVLNDPQKKIYDEMIRKRREQRPQQRRGKGMGRGRRR